MTRVLAVLALLAGLGGALGWLAAAAGRPRRIPAPRPHPGQRLPAAGAAIGRRHHPAAGRDRGRAEGGAGPAVAGDGGGAARLRPVRLRRRRHPAAGRAGGGAALPLPLPALARDPARGLHRRGAAAEAGGAAGRAALRRLAHPGPLRLRRPDRRLPRPGRGLARREPGGDRGWRLVRPRRRPRARCWSPAARAPGWMRRRSASPWPPSTQAFAAANPPPGARLLLSGPGVFAAEAAAGIERDVQRLTLTATLLLAGFLYWRFRSLAGAGAGRGAAAGGDAGRLCGGGGALRQRACHRAGLRRDHARAWWWTTRSCC